MFLMPHALRVALVATAFSIASGCLAIAPDFQQTEIPSQVIVDTDSLTGSGTIVFAENDNGTQLIWVPPRTTLYIPAEQQGLSGGTSR